MPLLFALISYFGWGSGDIFGTIAARKLGAYSASLYSYILRIGIFGLYIPFALADLSNLTRDTFLLNIGLGVLLLIGFVAFNEALRIANPSLVLSIAASFAALVVVLSVIFLKETLNSPQMVAILVIFAGILLSTLDFKGLRSGSFKLNRGVFLAFVAMVTWGIYFTFIKIPVQQIGWFWPNYISFTLFPLIFLYTKVRKIKLVPPTDKRGMLAVLAAVLLTGAAEFSFNFAISKGLTSVVAPIAGSNPTLFVILAFFVFKDPISRQQIAGIFSTLIGIVLLSFFSV